MSKAENKFRKLFADWRSSTLVLVWVGPFPANSFAMPAKDGLRLEDADNISQLICRSVGDAFQSSS